MELLNRVDIVIPSLSPPFENPMLTRVLQGHERIDKEEISGTVQILIDRGYDPRNNTTFFLCHTCADDREVKKRKAAERQRQVTFAQFLYHVAFVTDISFCYLMLLSRMFASEKCI